MGHSSLTFPNVNDNIVDMQYPSSLSSFTTLSREEALARAAELDAALHRSMRQRGELLIDPRDIERGERAAAEEAERAANRCPACPHPLSNHECLVVRTENGVRVAYHARCAPTAPMPPKGPRRHESWMVVYVLRGVRLESPASCREEARLAVDLLRREGLAAWPELRTKRLTECAR